MGLWIRWEAGKDWLEGVDSIVDTTRVEKEFGWKPEHTVGEYIEQIKAKSD
ncbi:MAG TPA: hypothetical protein VJG64_02695 [Candidatus Paceibacterota bacterium]